MEVITYSLRAGEDRSDRFYQDVAELADEVLREAGPAVGPLVRAYRAHLARTGGEEPRTEPEYTFELLMLGVLWRVYAAEALELAPAPRAILTGLAHARERAGRLKAAVDLLRGWTAGVALRWNGRRVEPVAPTPAHLDGLLSWLDATGAFAEEAQRLTPWRDFLREQGRAEFEAALDAVLALAEWFDARSTAALGRYTPNVDAFTAATRERYRWRDDRILCGRRRVEYHLNMVGTEILNRAFRAAFLAAPRKVVLVPPCMRAQPADVCRAQPTPFGAQCAACTPGCRVHQLTKLGQKHGFAVFMLPDELRSLSGSRAPAAPGTLGVIGVSCALTNTSGGWQTKALGVPAQGVLLDYCGCPWHWHPQGFPTDVNFRRILTVLGIDTPA